MIYIRIVYYQETIVALLIGFHLYSWILAIVLLNIQIIELNLSGDGSTSFTLNYRKFCDSCHICQFFLQRIIDMLAYCFDWIGKVELLLSVIFLVLCYIFLILCQIKSILEEKLKK